MLNKEKSFCEVLDKKDSMIYDREAKILQLERDLKDKNK